MGDWIDLQHLRLIELGGAGRASSRGDSGER